MATSRDTEESEEFWECPLCTFHNHGQSEGGKICTMCDAWECRRCFFTNRRGVRCKECSMYKTEKLVRLLLFGNKRSTRNAVAEVILDRDQSESGIVSTVDKRHIKNRDIAVINTPDFSSQDISVDKMSNEFWKFISMTLPGPHAFIMVKVGNSFTDQDHESFEWYKSIFGEEMIKHMVVVSYRCDAYSPSYDEGETDDIWKVPCIHLDNSKCRKDKDRDVLELLRIVDNIFHRYSLFQNQLYESLAEEKLHIYKQMDEKADIKKELATPQSYRSECTSDPDSNKEEVTKRTIDSLERRISKLEDKLKSQEYQCSHSDSSKKQTGDWSEWVPIVQKVGEHLIKFTIDYAVARFLR